MELDKVVSSARLTFGGESQQDQNQDINLQLGSSNFTSPGQGSLYSSQAKRLVEQKLVQAVQ